MVGTMFLTANMFEQHEIQINPKYDIENNRKKSQKDYVLNVNVERSSSVCMSYIVLVKAKTTIT